MKKLISLILCLNLLVCTFSHILPIAAVDTAKESLELDIFKKGNITNKSGVLNIVNDKKGIVVHSDIHTSTLSFSCEYNFPDLSSYTELAITLLVDADEASCPASISLAREGSVYKTNVTLKDGEQTVYIKLPDGEKKSFESLKFSFTDPDSVPNAITLISCKADRDFSYSYAERFGADIILSDFKTEKTPEAIFVFPENNTCTVTFSYLKPYTSDDTLTVTLDISDAISGNVYATANYENGESSSTSHQSIYGDGVYAFSLRGGFKSITFSFGELRTKGSSFALNSSAIKKLFSNEKSIGSISSCGISQGKLTLKGGLYASEAVKYYGAILYLYAIPTDELNGYYLKKYSPIAKAEFSTQFTLSATVDETYSLYHYVAALAFKGELIPIDDPRAPSTQSTTLPATSSINALCNAGDADVFASGISSAIIDITLSELFETEDTYSAVSYKFKNNYYFDPHILGDIDKKIAFYSACSVKPYIRISFDSITFTDKKDSLDQKMLEKSAAALSFLAAKYPTAQGFILSDLFDNTTNSAFAKNTNMQGVVIGALGDCIKSKNPSSLLFITMDTSTETSPYLHLFDLVSCTSHYGTSSFGIILEGNKYGTDIALLLSKLSSIAPSLSSASDGLGIIWNAPSETDNNTVCDLYRKMCVESASRSLRLCALSLKEFNEDAKHSLIEELKVALDAENFIPTSVSTFNAATEADTYTGKYSLWDFTSSYHTAGWVSGGDLSAPETAKDEEKRFLSSHLTEQSEGAGVLVGRLKTPADMSGLCAAVTLCVSSTSTENANIAIIFGSGEERAQYEASIPCNKTTTLYCDLEEYTGAGKIDFTAVILRSDSSEEIRISGIDLCSQTANDASLDERFANKETDPGNPLLYASVILTAAITVALFSVLLRKQKEKESKGEQNGEK